MTSNEIIDIYLQYREQGKLINSALLESLPQEDIPDCASLFNLIDDSGMLYFDDESDQDRLMDFAIHDYQKKSGKNALQKFAESSQYKSLPSTEKNILNAKINSVQSLFIVDYVKPDEALIGLKDVFNAYKDIEIVDTSLSRSLSAKKKYIFARIMQFEHFSCTTGVAYIFHGNKYNKVKNAYLKQLKNYSNLNARTRKAVAFFHVNKTLGLPVYYDEKISNAIR